MTARELEILKWMALGKSESVIADLFGVSEKDINNHIRDILEKLNASDRVRASIRAIKLGLV